MSLIRTVRRAALAWLILVVLGALLPSSPAAAPAVRDSSFWRLDRGADRIARAGDILVLQGEFTQVGPETGNTALVSRATGRPRQPWPRIWGDVHCVLSDGTGSWFVGGRFTGVGGVPRTNLARIRGDGSLENWNPTFDGPVRSLLRVGDTLYVGGSFTLADGRSRLRAAAFDLRAGKLLDWDPSANGDVLVLADAGNAVLIGGQFDRLRGQSVGALAAVGVSKGEDVGWRPGIVGTVRALAVAESTVYVGGSFASAGGAPRANIAELHRATASATAWNPGADNAVLALLLRGDCVFVGGRFSQCGGATRRVLGSVSRLTGAATSWDPHSAFGMLPLDEVRSLACDGGLVYVAGRLPHYGTPFQYRGVVAFDAESGVADSWMARPDADVTAMAMDGSDVLLGGPFESVAWWLRDGLVAMDLNTGRALPIQFEIPRRRHRTQILDMAARGDLLILSLLHRDTLQYWNTASSLAGYDLRQGGRLAWERTPNGAVNKLVPLGDTLYFTGFFGQVDGQDRRVGFAALDLRDGSLLADSLRDSTNLIRGAPWLLSLRYTENRMKRIDRSTMAVTSWGPALPAGVMWGAFEMDSSIVFHAPPGDVEGIRHEGVFALGKESGRPTGWTARLGSLPARAVCRSGPLLIASLDDQFTTLVACHLSTGERFDWQQVIPYSTSPSALLASHGRIFINFRESFAYLAPIADAPTVRILSPVPGDLWPVRSQQTIRWSVTTPDVITGVDVRWSSDGGASYPHVIGTNLPNTGSVVWVVPDTVLERVRFKVVARDRGLQESAAVSDGDISFGRALPTVEVLSPNGGESWLGGEPHTIRWTASADGGVARADVLLSRDGGATFPDTLARSLVGVDSLTVNTLGASSTRARVRVQARSNSGLAASDTSDADFEIRRIPIAVTSSGAGRVDAGGPAEADYQGGIIFRFWPDLHWFVRDVVADGVSRGAVPSWSFFWVIAPHTLHVEFGTLLGTDAEAITEFTLSPLAPNPVREDARVRFGLPRAAAVRVGLFDLQGREVRRLADGVLAAGWHHAELGAGRLEPGVYFLVMRSAGVQRLERVTIVR